MMEMAFNAEKKTGVRSRMEEDVTGMRNADWIVLESIPVSVIQGTEEMVTPHAGLMAVIHASGNTVSPVMKMQDVCEGMMALIVVDVGLDMTVMETDVQK